LNGGGPGKRFFITFQVMAFADVSPHDHHAVSAF
jgi:hypothetical protein